MSDFFGGVFDNMRGLVNTTDELFDTVLENIDAKSIMSSITETTKNRGNITVPKGSSRSPMSSDTVKAGSTKPQKISDPLDFERMWMERLKDFSNIEQNVARTRGKGI